MNILFNKDKQFYKKLIKIALPISLQNLIFTLLNMIDITMIGQLGKAEVAGVGAANKLFFLFNLFIFGVNSGAAIFVAQYWGVKDIKNIRRVLGISLSISVLGSLIFSYLALFKSEFVISIFNDDTEFIDAGVAYLKIIGASYFVTAISFSFCYALRSVGKATIPMVTSIVAVALNVIFNSIFIFGLLGFPAMGVRGAALGTLLARVIEVTVLLLIIYIGKNPLAASIKELFDWNKELVKNVVVKLTPVVLNEFFWSLGVIGYSVVYGHIGTEALAAMTILSTVEQLGMVLFFGMGNASAVMLGNALGNNELDKAWDYSKRFAILAPLLSVVIGIFIVGMAPFYMRLYDVEPIVKEYVVGCIIIYSLALPFKVFNTINIIGILRSGGDTYYTLFLDFFGVWLVGLPLGILGGYILGLDLYAVYALVLCEEVVKVIFGIKRYRSKKWIKNLIGQTSNT